MNPPLEEEVWEDHERGGGIISPFIKRRRVMKNKQAIVPVIEKEKEE